MRPLAVDQNDHFSDRGSVTSTVIKSKRIRKLKRKLFNFMDSALMQFFLALLLMLSLFLPDSWILGNAKYDDDSILYIILIIILIIFTLETIILSLVQEDYIFSFFFWMDTLGTVSIILDIGWISSHFMPDAGAASKGSLLRAARAAKLGARYGRLMRLMKLIRFFQISPMFC